MGDEAARYERNPAFIFRRIVEEFVLVPIHQDVSDMDCIYTLNEVGATVWQQLDQPATQAELQSRLLEQYEVDAAALQTDLEQFLQEMLSIGALRQAVP